MFASRGIFVLGTDAVPAPAAIHGAGKFILVASADPVVAQTAISVAAQRIFPGVTISVPANYRDPTIGRAARGIFSRAAGPVTTDVTVDRTAEDAFPLRASLVATHRGTVGTARIDGFTRIADTISAGRAVLGTVGGGLGGLTEAVAAIWRAAIDGTSARRLAQRTDAIATGWAVHRASLGRFVERANGIAAIAIAVSGADLDVLAA